MEYEAFFRRFDALTESEREQLTQLTIVPRSVFRRWLTHPSRDQLYAGCVRAGDQIVAWAAANTMDDPRILTVGVFVHPDRRGRGCARQALDVLLDGMRHIVRTPHTHANYMEGRERVFRPSVERFGFIDFHRPGVREEFLRAQLAREQMRAAERRAALAERTRDS
ncbi:GNAT family N-acetyltransferase [Candidatus Uhrbacteria bacterium]|nr:GNAT family N-acetyltransferase [Candidatus Uhrbacteria bacterium]